jgi:4-deoxy-L-threo-5-hexosulose-uronate ketol-isomerase
MSNRLHEVIHYSPQIMSTQYSIRFATNPDDFSSYDTSRLRSDFLIEQLFTPNDINLVYSHYDRFITGGALPVDGTIELETIAPLKSTYFLERRELGIINIGATGHVIVDGISYELDHKEALYVGRGAKEVHFKTGDHGQSCFYLNSAPAHASYPTKKVSKNDMETVELGSLESSNHRVIYKLIVNSIVQTCQLQMGMTQLKQGSVWNTMPAHLHDRRMEVYLYFEVPENQVVCHFLGEPSNTRHIWVQNQQAVFSPPWSIHSGAGTSNYSFIWGMAGENLDYGDMEVIKTTDLK